MKHDPISKATQRMTKLVTLVVCTCASLFTLCVVCVTFLLLLKYLTYYSAHIENTHNRSLTNSTAQTHNVHHVWVRRSLDGDGGPGKVSKTTSEPPPANLNQPWELNTRLEANVIPSYYEILLQPNLDNKLFSGSADITVDVLNATSYIYLHMNALQMENTTITGGPQGASVQLQATFNYSRHQFWVLTFTSSIPPGKYVLGFKFKAAFTKNTEGFYESAYLNFKNHKRNIATSKFEPTFARQAFPCFDEPSMKANFSVKLVKPKEKYIALSNMNVKSITDDSPREGQSTVEFETTVPMSTYLVCFIVCDFDHLPSQNASSGFPITVYAREGQLEYMAFAQDTAIKAINFYIEYFGIDYPLPKLDLIAIPDFVSGAMEHWGLVTFREASVIYKKGSSSVVNMKRVAMTTSHELAHMWFGDLCTMKWWNDLWLNEGFASYMQYKALSSVQPTWEVDTMFLTDMLHSTLQLDQTLSSHPIVQTVSNPDQITEIFDMRRLRNDTMFLTDMLHSTLQLDQTLSSHPIVQTVSNPDQITEIFDMRRLRNDTMFLTDMLHSTLQLDQTLSSHPIVQTVSNPDQITEIFDMISYQKGSSVIRMLENMMGADNFAKGVSSYLTEFKYSNAETQDLWNHLQKFADDMSVTNVMDTYTRQMGFPLITVNRSGDTLTFTQSRYLSNVRSKYNASDSPYGYTWDVHITVMTYPNQSQSVWLYRNMAEATITLPPNTAWVKINKNQVGYFRVSYDTEMWNALVNQLMTDPMALDARDRSNLLDDIFSLAETQRMNYSVAFDLLKYMSKEDHFAPWSVVLNKLTKIKEKLYSAEGHTEFVNYIRCILKDRLSDETWNVENATFLQINAKLTLNELGCTFGVASCLRKARELLTKWFASGEKPLADLRGLVYRFGMVDVSEIEWNTMWGKFQEETNPQEQVKMLGGLANVNNPQLLGNFLEMAKEENNIRSQDYFNVIALVGNNPVGLPIAWNYTKTNWNYMVKRFGLNSRVFGRIIPNVCGRFTSEDTLQEVKDFFTQYPEAGAGAAGRKQGLEMIQNNIKWLKIQGKPLAEWLKDKTCADDDPGATSTKGP